MIQCASEMEVVRYKFDKFDVDYRFLQRVPAISSCREASPPSSASTGDMDVRIRSGSMSSVYHAEYEESDSDSDHDCNAIDMSVIKNGIGPGGDDDQHSERMNIDMASRTHQRTLSDLMVERGHGPPPPQLVMRDPHASRDDLNRMANESPLSSSGSSSSPSLLIAGAHGGLAGHGVNHSGLESHTRSNGISGPPLPPPPFLSQLAQSGTNHLMQQMQPHGASGIPGGGGILLTTNESKGRHSSFSSVNSSDGTISPPPHTIPNQSHHTGNPLNQHQLPFVPQHIPHDLVHKMSSGQKKKLPTPIPKECKDEAYWERRKRNNESAKRSRELRRIKEQQTTLRVLYLEQENLQLRTELGMLRSEVDKLRQLVYVTNKQQGRASSSGSAPQQQQQQLQGSRGSPQAVASGALAEQIMEESRLSQNTHSSLISPPGNGGRSSSPLPPPPPPPPQSPPPPQANPALVAHQPLPPISTLQCAMAGAGQPPRQIILASPPSRPTTLVHSGLVQTMSPPPCGSPAPASPQPPPPPPPPQQQPQQPPALALRGSPSRSLSPALHQTTGHQMHPLRQQTPPQPATAAAMLLSQRPEMCVSPQTVVGVEEAATATVSSAAAATASLPSSLSSSTSSSLSSPSPCSSSPPCRDAIDLSPISPPANHHHHHHHHHQQQQQQQDRTSAESMCSTSSSNGDQARPLALVQSSASDAQPVCSTGGSSNGFRASFQSHNGAGQDDSITSGCNSTTTNSSSISSRCERQHQQQHQHPLQPAILRHKKARPSGPYRVSPSPSPPQQQQQHQSQISTQIEHSAKVTDVTPSSLEDENRVENNNNKIIMDRSNNNNNNSNNTGPENDTHHQQHSQQQHHHHYHAHTQMQLSQQQHQQQQQQQQQIQSQRQHSVVVQS